MKALDWNKVVVYTPQVCERLNAADQAYLVVLTDEELDNHLHDIL